MKKKLILKKVKISAGVIALTLVLVTSLDTVANGGFACNGVSFAACGAWEVETIRKDSRSNGCYDSNITVYAVDNGNQYNWYQYDPGSNSSCPNL